jgi:hypothetical protein
MKNQIRFQLIGGQLKEVISIDMQDVSLKPLNISELSDKIKIQFIDIKELKKTWNRLKNDWFPIGQKNTTLAVGVFWTAFMTYIFPWMLDIAKVYCCFMIAQGFYKEHKGVTGREGRSGFQSLVYYGKWLIAFHLIPVGVTLIDQIGIKMMTELQNQPLGN